MRRIALFSLLFVIACSGTQNLGGNGGGGAATMASTGGAGGATSTTGTGGSAPTCTDAVKNGAETDVDCGGPACPPCAVGKVCAVAADCQSGACTGGICVPAQGGSCADMVKNGAETDVDCGGPDCGKCAAGKVCIVGADCQTGICAAGICQLDTCTDGIQNGTETDVDCGGTCPPCALGKKCITGTDCASHGCSEGMCVPTPGGSCTDAVKNGAETDVDCGGPVCAPCAVGKLCIAPSDCLSHTCTSGVCQP